MSPLDLSLLALIGVSALFGFLRGFVGVVVSVLAWVLAGWMAFRHGASVALWLADGQPPGLTELFGGYALSFVAVMVFVGLVGWVIRKFVKGVGLSGLDRLLGLGLGLARGLIVACMAVLLMGFTEMPREPAWRESQVLPLLLPGAEWMRGWLPDWAAEQIAFGHGVPNGDNGGHSESSLPVPLDEGVPQPAVEQAPAPEPSAPELPTPD